MLSSVRKRTHLNGILPGHSHCGLPDFRYSLVTQTKTADVLPVTRPWTAIGFVDYVFDGTPAKGQGTRRLALSRWRVVVKDVLLPHCRPQLRYVNVAAWLPKASLNNFHKHLESVDVGVWYLEDGRLSSSFALLVAPLKPASLWIRKCKAEKCPNGKGGSITV